MSIYQDSDAMFYLFYQVVVINGGCRIFYGKGSDAKTYFERLGFICPDGTTTTDISNSMTTKPAYCERLPISGPLDANSACESVRSKRII